MNKDNTIILRKKYMKKGVVGRGESEKPFTIFFF
jgi:hypothetical protein